MYLCWGRAIKSAAHTWTPSQEMERSEALVDLSAWKRWGSARCIAHVLYYEFNEQCGDEAEPKLGRSSC